MWSNAGNGRILGIKLVKIQGKMEWMFEVASTGVIRFAIVKSAQDVRAKTANPWSDLGNAFPKSRDMGKYTARIGMEKCTWLSANRVTPN